MSDKPRRIQNGQATKTLGDRIGANATSALKVLDGRAKRLSEKTKQKKRLHLEVKAEEYATLLDWAERWDEPVAAMTMACFRAGMAVLRERSVNAAFNPFLVYGQTPALPTPPPNADPTGYHLPPPPLPRAIQPQPPALDAPPRGHTQYFEEVESVFAAPPPNEALRRFLPNGATENAPPPAPPQRPQFGWGSGAQAFDNGENPAEHHPLQPPPLDDLARPFHVEHPPATPPPSQPQAVEPPVVTPEPTPEPQAAVPEQAPVVVPEPVAHTSAFICDCGKDCKNPGGLGKHRKNCEHLLAAKA